MSCNIRAHLELTPHRGGHNEHIAPARFTHDHDLFAMLSRPHDETDIRPVVEPRDLPEDLTPLVVSKVRASQPIYGSSWLSLEEVRTVLERYTQHTAGTNPELLKVVRRMHNLTRRGTPRLVLWFTS